jgi:putative hydrolase of the HAD superfamily
MSRGFPGSFNFIFFSLSSILNFLYLCFMSIKAISFDFWNTLYYDHQVMYERHNKRVNRLKEALGKNGYDSQLDVEGSFQYCWEYFDKIWKDKQKTLNARELLLIGCDWLNITLPEEDIFSVSEYYEEVLLENPPVLFEGVKEIIPELAKRFKLGITSDTAYTPGRVLRKLLEKDDLLKHFSAFAYSDEIGRSKPHIDTFNSTLKQLGVEPDETVHVGDNEFTDIIGAISAGMKSIIFMGAIEREVSFTEADYAANDWKELQKILVNFNSRTD